MSEKPWWETHGEIYFYFLGLHSEEAKSNKTDRTNRTDEVSVVGLEDGLD